MCNHERHRTQFEIVMDFAVFTVMAYGLIHLVVWLFSKPKDEKPNSQK